MRTTLLARFAPWRILQANPYGKDNGLTNIATSVQILLIT